MKPLGNLNSAKQLFLECGDAISPLNDFNSKANYANYQTFKFANPCGRLALLFPTDDIMYLESINDKNTVIGVDDIGLASAFTKRFPVVSNGQWVDATSERFANWMVI